MPNVLIRDVPPDDLDQIRAAAAERDTSLQGYLREAVHAQAVYLRRRAALSRAAERLRDHPEVPDEERAAVMATVEGAHVERGEELGGGSER